MQPSSPHTLRPPAVAGTFYPASAAALRADVDALLTTQQARGPAPKAIVVPHAGYVYSGGVAAAAYVQLRDAAHELRRVVVVGPSHRVGFRGLAVPAAAAFATPLGTIRIDAGLRQQALTHPAVITSDAAHQFEHSLEVQLPFLQATLHDFTLLPLVAGDASPEDVAAVLERVWGGNDTLLVISTDLSHYLDYATANARDAATSRHILALKADLEGEDACGCVGLNGFLVAARRRGLTPRALSRCNSGDTSGDRRRVVGYGAFAFYEQPDVSH
jgi:AmmeMemoRadiSam system protein B